MRQGRFRTLDGSGDAELLGKGCAGSHSARAGRRAGLGGVRSARGVWSGRVSGKGTEVISIKPYHLL